MASGPTRCLECLVRDTSLCAAMRDDEIDVLSQIARRKLFPAGQVITWSGDPNTLCANIVTGAAKVTASMADGREQIVGLLYPGDFLGQPFAEHAPLTITAVSDTDLCLFPRAPFERTLGVYPRMERMLLERTLASLNAAQQRILSLGRKNATERVAGFVLEVLDKTTTSGAADSVIELPISRGEMADFLGLTIETVSRQLTRLRSAGILAFSKGDRSFTVLDRDALENTALPH